MTRRIGWDGIRRVTKVKVMCYFLNWWLVHKCAFNFNILLYIYVYWFIINI